MNEVISNSFTITITKSNTSDGGSGSVSDKQIIIKDGSFLVTKLGDSIIYK